MLKWKYLEALPSGLQLKAKLANGSIVNFLRQNDGKVEFSLPVYLAGNAVDPLQPVTLQQLEAAINDLAGDSEMDLSQLEQRVDALEERADQNDTLNTTQNNRLYELEMFRGAVDNRVTAIETEQGQQNTRLAALEAEELDAANVTYTPEDASQFPAANGVGAVPAPAGALVYHRFENFALGNYNNEAPADQVALQAIGDVQEATILNSKAVRFAPESYLRRAELPDFGSGAFSVEVDFIHEGQPATIIDLINNSDPNGNGGWLGFIFNDRVLFNNATASKQVVGYPAEVGIDIRDGNKHRIAWSRDDEGRAYIHVDGKRVPVSSTMDGTRQTRVNFTGGFAIPGYLEDRNLIVGALRGRPASMGGFSLDNVLVTMGQIRYGLSDVAVVDYDAGSTPNPVNTVKEALDVLAAGVKDGKAKDVTQDAAIAAVVARNVEQDGNIAAARAIAEAAIPLAQKGAVNGVAPLDETSKIPAAYLPGFVDDVLEYADLAAFPAAGEQGKLYVAIDSGKTYRWSGTVYTEVSPSEVTTVNGKRGAVSLNSDEIPEGQTNLYFTPARAVAALDSALEDSESIEFVQGSAAGRLLANLRDDSVSSAKIKALAITTAKLADLAVTTAKLADGAVGKAKIAADAVDGEKILIASGQALRFESSSPEPHSVYVNEDDNLAYDGTLVTGQLGTANSGSLMYAAKLTGTLNNFDINSKAGGAIRIRTAAGAATGSITLATGAATTPGARGSLILDGRTVSVAADEQLTFIAPNVSMNDNRLQNVADPTAAQDAVNRRSMEAYVAAQAGVAEKETFTLTANQKTVTLANQAQAKTVSVIVDGLGATVEGITWTQSIVAGKTVVSFDQGNIADLLEAGDVVQVAYRY